ncbi:TPA: LysR substrate-binding domain-containing protein [Klebsiella pneumoniae]
MFWRPGGLLRQLHFASYRCLASHRVADLRISRSLPGDGHGIALARSIMVDDDIKSGRLIRLCPDVSLTSPLSYYLVYRPGCDSLPKIANFRAWIIEQAQAFNHAINPGNLSSKIEPL